MTATTSREGGGERLDLAAGRWTGAAPAKVNLFLRVLAREDSGFHQLETLFQTLALADRVTVERVDAPAGTCAISLEVTGVGAETLGPPEQNLAVRAARAFLEAVGDGKLAPQGAGVHLHLEKHIPHGAGLGGGSSDAAAVLKGMNALYGDPLEAGALARLGATLGADVAFFLCGSPLALAWGRGDRLLPLAPLPRRPVLLAIPHPGIATPWAYGRLAEYREQVGGQVGVQGLAPAGGAPGARLHVGGAHRWSQWEGVEGDQENAFEAALAPHRPELEVIRAALEGAGARVARLSGSGAAVFGVFADGSSAGGEGRAEAGVQAGRRAIIAALGDGAGELRLIETHTG